MDTLDTPTTVDAIRAEFLLNATSTSENAKRFFKTSAGSYSEHDAFLGIAVPALRKIAKKYQQAGREVVVDLLNSKYNEERLLALLILVNQYQKGKPHHKEEICQFYLTNLCFVNNWNLVDSSAHLILGHYLWDKDRSLLQKLAKSSLLWERRIAIIATWFFIRKGDLSTTFDIAKLLLNDTHDLIHKAVGWMLREAGKKDTSLLISYLDTYAKQMPRTMLRYAIEKFPEDERQAYLQ